MDRKTLDWEIVELTNKLLDAKNTINKLEELNVCSRGGRGRGGREGASWQSCSLGQGPALTSLCLQERYRLDCNLAVQLLKCNKSHFRNHKFADVSRSLLTWASPRKTCSFVSHDSFLSPTASLSALLSSLSVFLQTLHWVLS